MDVFDLDDRLLDQYTAFARSFARIRSRELQSKVDALYAGRQFWPEPLVQLNPHYEDGGTLLSLVGESGLSDDCAKIFVDPRAKPGAPDRSIKLRRHQEQAIGLALDEESFVVTTGTGSGKSLCFFIPIVTPSSASVPWDEAPHPRHRHLSDERPGKQPARGDQEVPGCPDMAHPVPSPATRARKRRTSGERDREEQPPDILLTNFMMLELLMTRQNGARSAQSSRIVTASVPRARRASHLSRPPGRRRRHARAAGARRGLAIPNAFRSVSEPRPPWRARPARPTARDRRRRGLQMFGTSIARDAIITETLKRATDPSRSADHGLANLGEAVDRANSGKAYDGKSNAEVADDPLAIWVETRLGLSSLDSKPIRATPLSSVDAAKLLSQAQSGQLTGAPPP